MKRTFKPSSADLVVRDPVTLEMLPVDGKTVDDSPYWRRRLSSGDVVEIKAAAKKKPAKTEQKES